MHLNAQLHNLARHQKTKKETNQMPEKQQHKDNPNESQLKVEPAGFLARLKKKQKNKTPLRHFILPGYSSPAELSTNKTVLQHKMHINLHVKDKPISGKCMIYSKSQLEAFWLQIPSCRSIISSLCTSPK